MTTDPQTDKLYEHHRQQLSAMLDGELAPDQAKFMLRRLEHDAELAACWERWQVGGDVLRGCHEALLPRDFSQRVADAIAQRQPGSPAAKAAVAAARSKWTRWSGGAALAASVAMVAVLVARQLPEVEPAATATPARVAASAAAPVAQTIAATDAYVAPAAQAPDAGKPDAPATPAAALATAVAVTEVPRRMAERSTRAQSQRAAARIRRSADAPAMVAASTPAVMTPAREPATALAEALPAAPGLVDPFAAGPAKRSRPWPRAILPNYSAGNAFTASYGGNAASSSFHPFEPRVDLAPAQAGDEPQGGNTGPR